MVPVVHKIVHNQASLVAGVLPCTNFPCSRSYWSTLVCVCVPPLLSRNKHCRNVANAETMATTPVQCFKKPTGYSQISVCWLNDRKVHHKGGEKKSANEQHKQQLQWTALKFFVFVFCFRRSRWKAKASTTPQANKISPHSANNFQHNHRFLDRRIVRTSWL